jgi:hypothetical protein
MRAKCLAYWTKASGSCCSRVSSGQASRMLRGPPKVAFLPQGGNPHPPFLLVLSLGLRLSLASPGFTLMRRERKEIGRCMAVTPRRTTTLL